MLDAIGAFLGQTWLGSIIPVSGREERQAREESERAYVATRNNRTNPLTQASRNP